VEQRRRRLVQGLHVVNGNHDTVAPAEPSQRVQKREGYEALLHRTTGGEAECRLQSAPLRPGQLGQHLGDVFAEEICES
jgi:hypothetical protein